MKVKFVGVCGRPKYTKGFVVASLRGMPDTTIPTKHFEQPKYNRKNYKNCNFGVKIKDLKSQVSTCSAMKASNNTEKLLWK